MAHSDLGRTALLLIVPAVFSGCAKPAGTAAGQATPGAPPALNTQGKSLAQLFQGRSGVEVESVGDGVRLRIRASGDFEGKRDPLFVIDGTPISPPDGVLFMNPNDIVSIEILKDDASTAIYGLRGANGVVKIATKRR